MVTPVLLLILAGFAISLPATFAARAIGRRIGTMDSAGVRGHAKVLRPIPNVGGVAIFLGIADPDGPRSGR